MEHISRDQAFNLLKKYNNDPFHIQHALTVEAVMKWYANELGYGITVDVAPEHEMEKVLFAAGCSREVIERGVDQLGWELDKLLTMTLDAMKATEDEINAEM